MKTETETEVNLTLDWLNGHVEDLCRTISEGEYNKLQPKKVQDIIQILDSLIDDES